MCDDVDDVVIAFFFCVVWVVDDDLFLFWFWFRLLEIVWCLCPCLESSLSIEKVVDLDILTHELVDVDPKIVVGVGEDHVDDLVGVPIAVECLSLLVSCLDLSEDPPDGSFQ